MKLILQKVSTVFAVLLVALLPIQTVWIFFQFQLGEAQGIWQYGTLGLYGTDILALAFIVLQAIRLVRKEISFDYKRNRVALVFLSIFLLIAACSILWSPIKGLSIFYTARLLGMVLLCLAIFVSGVSQRMMSYAWSAAALITSLFGFIQLITQEVFGSSLLGTAFHSAMVLGDAVVQAGDERFLRLYGTFPHPNIFAAFLVVTIAWCMYGYVQEEQVLQRTWFLFCVAISTSALFFTFSRSGWIALCLVLLIQFLGMAIMREFGLLRNMALVMGGIALIFFLGAGPLITTRLQGQERLEQQSVSQRISSLHQGLAIIARVPLQGIGIGAYTYDLYQRSNVDSARYTFMYQPAHNFFLMIFGELGIFALLSFLGFIVAVCIALFKAFWQRKDDFYTITQLAIVGALLVMALFDHFFFTTHAGLLLWWVSMGLALKRPLTRA